MLTILILMLALTPLVYTVASLLRTMDRVMPMPRPTTKVDMAQAELDRAIGALHDRAYPYFSS